MISKSPRKKDRQNRIMTDSETLMMKSSWNNFNQTKEERSEFPTNAQKNPAKKPPHEKSRLDQTTWGLIIHDFSPLLGVQKNLLSSNSWTVKEMRSPTCRVEGTFREAEHLLPTIFNGCPHNKRLVHVTVMCLFRWTYKILRKWK